MNKILTFFFALAVMISSLTIGGRGWALELQDIPDLPTDDRTWVVDFADIISAATETEIDRKLDNLEKTTGQAVRFITVPRIDFGQPAEEFLLELFTKWFPTEAAGDNQTLLLIAAEDHRTAWQAGTGVQKILAAETLESIITESMLPPVKGTRFNQALSEGAKRVLAILAGESDPGPPPIVVQVATAPVEPIDPKTSSVWVFGLVAVATIVPMATYFLMQR